MLLLRLLHHFNCSLPFHQLISDWKLGEWWTSKFHPRYLQTVRNQLMDACIRRYNHKRSCPSKMFTPQNTLKLNCYQLTFILEHVTRESLDIKLFYLRPHPPTVPLVNSTENVATACLWNSYQTLTCSLRESNIIGHLVTGQRGRQTSKELKEK